MANAYQLMKINTLIVAVIVGLSGLSARAADTNEPVQLFMPDGQLKSHPLRVFVDRDITASMKPMLRLTGGHAVIRRQESEVQAHPAMLVARHQKSIQMIDGQEVSFTGTLLLFDLRERFHIPFYKAVARVTPTLMWEEPGRGGQGGEVEVTMGPHEVYLGSIVGALGWTFLVISVLVFGIAGLCVATGKGALNLITAPDGHLSLWRAQLAAWTVAIGSVVFCFGLTRLELPKIPDTLVALMGLSLATGGLSYLAGNQTEKSVKRGVEPATNRRRSLLKGLSELICDYDSAESGGEISISRTQMLFWTVLMLFLFFIKSIQESGLWAVPWEMVALMGMSQAGYVGSKFVQSKPSRPGLPSV